MGTLLKFGLWLLGLFIPALKPPSPEAEAQKAKDQAEGATSALKAKVQSDAIEQNVADAAAADPSSLRKPDKFQL